MSFEVFWKSLTEELSDAVLVRNWTADNGYLGRGDFTAVFRGGNYVECSVPGALNLQRVPKKDFEFMYMNWNDYIKGRVKRPQLRNRSRFTKYTISILHQYQHLL